MKKTIFVTLVMALAVFQANSAIAESVKIETDIQDSQGRETHLQIELANGHDEALALFKQKSKMLGSASIRIVVSDMSATAVAKELGQNLPQEIKEVTDQAIGFFEIDEPVEKFSEQSHHDRKKEHIQGVAFALAQTGVSVAAFVFISNLPLEPALVSASLSGFLNLYFNWDIERWDKFQRWGRDKMAAGAALLGKPDWRHANWFNKTSKSVTGYVGRIGFAALFTGVALWDQFSTQFLSMHTAERIALSSFIGAMMSQSFDTTFGDWLEKGHKIFTPEQIKLMMRMRSLITSAIIPLVYLEYKSAYVMAAGMFMAGIAVATYDQHENIEEKLVFSIERIKNSVKNFWKSKFSDPLCALYLKRGEGS